MYRILIADDEANIRQGIARFIARNCPDFTVAGTAEDGREALRLAADILPDVILTDIAMPHMNGLDFLESIAGVLPDARLVVISGYDAFEYARKALRLGVREYLLKPIDTDKLQEVLTNIKGELDIESHRWQQLITLKPEHSSRDTELQNFCRAAVMGISLPKLSVQCADFTPDCGCYCIVVYSGELEGNLLCASLCERLQGLAQIVSVLIPHAEALVFSMHAMTQNSAFLHLTQALTAVGVRFKRELGVSLCFYIGDVVDCPEKIDVSFRQATQAQAVYFKGTEPMVVSHADVLARQMQPCVFPPAQLGRDLSLAVLNRSDALIQEKTEQLFSLLASGNLQDAEFIRLCVLSVCFSILDANASAVRGMSYFEFTNVQKEFSAANDLTELHICFENFLRVLCNRRPADDTTHRVIADKVDALIEEHLDDTEFSLDDVASRLFLSPNYLRQLFKQETGTTFVEYITKTRMEQACILLACPTKKICDVALAVGYNDSRYFSVCFKKQFHQTPSEYQTSACKI